MSPSLDVTLRVHSNVELRKAHRPHAVVISERGLELYKSQIVVIGFVNIFRVAYDFLDCHVLLVAFTST